MRATPPALGELLSRGAHAGDVAAKALSASRDAALATAERITRREGADQAADALHSMRSAAGVLEADELPITDYDALNVSQAVAAIKELTTPSDVRAILAYEEAHKNRQGVSAASRQVHSRFRGHAAASAAQRGNHFKGRLTGTSDISIRQPSATALSRSVIRAAPKGRPLASRTSSCSGSQATATVSSLRRAGHTPIEWWMVLPGLGQEGSTARMRLLPTTHCEYVQPSAMTSHTCCRLAVVSRVTTNELRAREEGSWRP